MIREEWLSALVTALRPMFSALGEPVPEKVRVSCGWPSRGGLSARNRAIGQAWSPLASADGTHETFISPYLDDAPTVAHVLVHELAHHAVGVECGHKGSFKRLAGKLGLVGKMTATTASPELAARLNVLTDALGPYPHAKVDAKLAGRKKQGTRMLKVTCSECSAIVRMTATTIEAAGLPTCGCGGAMTQA